VICQVNDALLDEMAWEKAAVAEPVSMERLPWPVA
jgi:hypothetical protein